MNSADGDKHAHWPAWATIWMCSSSPFVDRGQGRQKNRSSATPLATTPSERCWHVRGMSAPMPSIRPVRPLCVSNLLHGEGDPRAYVTGCRRCPVLAGWSSSSTRSATGSCCPESNSGQTITSRRSWNWPSTTRCRLQLRPRKRAGSAGCSRCWRWRFRLDRLHVALPRPERASLALALIMGGALAASSTASASAPSRRFHPVAYRLFYWSGLQHRRFGNHRRCGVWSGPVFRIRRTCR